MTLRKQSGMLLGLILICLAAPAATGNTHSARDVARDAEWTKAFAAPGPPSTSQTPTGRASSLETDPRLKALLAASFPQRQWFWYDHWKLTPLPEMMQLFMGVAGNSVLDGNRYITVDGCVPHDCVANRGMLWIDTGANPAVLIFAGINRVSGSSGEPGDRLWIFTSAKLNWQQLPQPFVDSMNRWLITIGTKRYAGTEGYHYHFVLATIVQPNGVMVDLEPSALHLDAASIKAGAGL